MTDQVLTGLLQTLGPIGTVIVVLGLALRALHKQLTEAHEKRVADAQASTQKLLELVEAQHQQIELLAKAIDAGTDASREMRLLIESLVAERGLHRLPSVPRRGGG